MMKVFGLYLSMNKFYILGIVLILIFSLGIIFLRLKPNIQSQTTTGQSHSGNVNFAYVNDKKYIIYNNRDLGPGRCPVVNGNNITFLGLNSRETFFDGREMGISDNIPTDECPIPVSMDSGHIAFFRDTMSGSDYTRFEVIYDGKAVGSGEQGAIDGNIALSGNHILYARPGGSWSGLNSTEPHVIYDGKDLGIGYDALISGDHYGYVTSNSHIIYDGKDLGSGGSLMMKGNSFGYIARKNMTDIGHMIFNGKDLGVGDTPCDLNEKHMVCVRADGKQWLDKKVIDSRSPEYHVILDGKDLGLGYHPLLDGDNLIYELPPENYAIIYNGKTVGHGFSYYYSVNDGDYAFLTSNDVSHLIYNGKDFGPAGPEFKLVNHNIVFDNPSHMEITFNGKTFAGSKFSMTSKP